MSDDLPASAGNNQISTNNPVIPASPAGRQSQTTGGINKEVGNASVGQEVPLSNEVGREADVLPKEVASAGVTMHPTTIPVPPPIAKMGVQPAGANIPMPTAAALPITDDQIAQGLGKGIRESFRWLAEWCVRRLKQVHIGLQSIRGKLVRVQTH